MRVSTMRNIFVAFPKLKKWKTLKSSKTLNHVLISALNVVPELNVFNAFNEIPK